jgi:hypothetical protein
MLEKDLSKIREMVEDNISKATSLITEYLVEKEKVSEDEMKVVEEILRRIDTKEFPEFEMGKKKGAHKSYYMNWILRLLKKEIAELEKRKGSVNKELVSKNERMDLVLRIIQEREKLKEAV